MKSPKLLLPLGGKPMLERVLRTFRRSRVDSVVVVLGAEERRARSEVEFKGERVVVNRRYSRGMSGSLKTGLRAVEGKADAVVVALGDQPFLSSGTVDRLVGAYARSGASIVLPVYRGKRGNPVLFDRRLFPELMRIEGDVGAKSVVQKHGSEVMEVVVEDRGVLLDVDTPREYDAALSSLMRSKRKRQRSRHGAAGSATLGLRTDGGLINR
jgi:molybdenum cofactor cytidylyltransferase